MLHFFAKSIATAALLLCACISHAQPWMAAIDSLQDRAQYQAALAVLLSVEKNYAQQNDWEGYSHALNRQAALYGQMGQFDTALVVVNRSIALIVNKLGNAPVISIDAQNALGLIQLHKGRSDLAMNAFQHAWELCKTAHGTATNAQTAQSLSNLALVHFDRRNFNEALDYHTQALGMRIGLFGKTHLAVAASYNDMGLIYADTEPDKALEYYEMAADIYTELLGNAHPKVANGFINIGNIYLARQEYYKATDYFERALSIAKLVYGEAHPYTAFALSSLGNAYTEAKDAVRGRALVEQALAIYNKVYGNRHPQVAQAYSLIGRMESNDGHFEEALKLYQRALQANSLEFSGLAFAENPSGNDYANPMLMLEILLRKAAALEAHHYSKTLRFQDLKNALASLETCDDLLQRIRQQRNSKADKIALGHYAVDLYGRSIRLCLAMAQVSAQPKLYREKAFGFSEKSKAATLLASISDTKAKQFANIPQELLEEERVFQSGIALLEQQLAGDLPDRTRYQQDIFALRQQYQSFIMALEKKFPAYYNLKYNVEMASIAQLQARLHEKQALFSFFIAEEDKRIYIFRIDKQHFKVWNVPKSDLLAQWLVGFENGVLFQVDQVVAIVGQQLFAQLFPKGSLKGVEQLLIVPDGSLGKLPFEALIASYSAKNLPEEAINTNFMAKQYRISYAYSATLYAQSKPARASQGQEKMLLCAPVNFKGDGIRSFLSSLPGTEAEVADIAEIARKANLEVGVYMKEEAQEQLLKSEILAQYAYVHFATHGTVNEEQPELSQLFLRAGGTDDGDLYAGEIYTLQLKAKLAVLSACETGLGKVTKGEGMIGLSRALIYAGAENLVVSLWSVSDASTAALLGNFYEYALSRGLSYTAALREAKRELMNDPSHASPYYWAPFILIGE